MAQNHAIHKSQPINDRSSTFVALYSPTASASALLSHPALNGATHKMYASRLPSRQATLSGSRTLETVTDDDGEAHGARHILGVMETANATGVCIVGRWYGGVLLGPARFRHIEAVAGNAVLAGIKAAGGTLKRPRAPSPAAADAAPKKPRVSPEEQQEKDALVADLTERDANILVLRQMVADHTATLQELQGAQESAEVKARHDARKIHAPASSSQTAPEPYADMPLQRLRVLEKARDGTVSFLLKRIDESEKRIAALRGPADEAQQSEPASSNTDEPNDHDGCGQQQPAA